MTRKQNIAKIEKMIRLYPSGGFNFWFVSSVKEIVFLDYSDMYFKTANMEGWSYNDLTDQEIETICREIANTIQSDLECKIQNMQSKLVEFNKKFMV